MKSNFEEIITQIPKIGDEMFRLMVELFPICRSITGNGLRNTLKILSKHISLEIHEVPTGTKVFDWMIPREWNINDAYIKNSKGEKIVDFKKSNLHVLNYSAPINTKISLEELKPHLFTLPEHPNVIPYRTSYYKENWGFCLTHNQFLQLEDDLYEVVIDSSLVDGSLTYGEYFLKGKNDDEVLFSCYPCHPSMCNDNLSGIVLLTFLAKYLGNLTLNYSYRFLFVPETIGAITWLSKNESKIEKIKHGLVASCVGDSGTSSYKKSRQGNAIIDQAVINVLKNSGENYKIIDFKPIGSDERQYCSPGFNIPIGSLQRTIPPDFPEYHTSADDTNFVQGRYLANTFSKYLSVIYILENNKTYVNLNPKCEPQLGKTGLYRMIGGPRKLIINELAILWVLNYSDGEHSLLDISDVSGIKFEQIKIVANALINCNLLKEKNIHD